MSSSFQGAKLTGSSVYFAPQPARGLSDRRKIYEENRHRVYALAFWMTDNELVAEELMKDVFSKVFALRAFEPEEIDNVFISELQKYIDLNPPSLRCAPSTSVSGVRKNVLRTDLERAVVQLPATERLIFLMHDVEAYDHARISRLLGLTEQQSQHALHQTRLRIRELLETRHS